MGAYVNPETESKEAFLEREGNEVIWKNRPAWEGTKAGYLPVILVNNGKFSAAGIAFSKREYEIKTDPHDVRPRRLFLVREEKLHLVSKELEKYQMSVKKMENE